MNYRKLGKTGLMVSEIGLGGEWLERHSTEEVYDIIKYCEKVGINILDCWMSNPKVRSDIGNAIKDSRERWYIQGHLGSTWQNGQYMKTRDMDKVKAAFQDLLDRMGTDYIDLGMIHYVDEIAEFNSIINGEFYDYIKSLKDTGAIHHIGIGTHNPDVAKLAALCGKIELILFSINPAFDMLPPTDNIDNYFAEKYDESLGGIASERAELYKLCEQQEVALTVMKGYGGGRLFSAEASPFGVALTPVQCLHYALTRPGVASVLVGYDTVEQVDAAIAYESATDDEKDYASVLANAPHHAYSGQCTYCGHCAPCPAHIDIAMVNKLYDLATMQDTVPATLKSHYDELKAHASDCTGCGGCEKRCPFGVKVVDRMLRAKDVFNG